MTRDDVIKIGDFGLSKILEGKQTNADTVGTSF